MTFLFYGALYCTTLRYNDDNWTVYIYLYIVYTAVLGLSGNDFKNNKL